MNKNNVYRFKTESHSVIYHARFVRMMITLMLMSLLTIWSLSANADTNDSLKLFSQYQGQGMTYAIAGNSEIVYNTTPGNIQVCAKNNGAATSSNLLNADGTNLTFPGDTSIQAVYLQWYALVQNTDPDGSNLDSLNPLSDTVSLTLPDGSVHTVMGSKAYQETVSFTTGSALYQGFTADITALVSAMPLDTADGSYSVDLKGQNDATLPQFINACALSEENARAWQMTVIYASPLTDSNTKIIYFYDGLQGLVDQTGVITQIKDYQVPSSGDTTGSMTVMTLQGDAALPGESLQTSDTLFPDMPVDFANSAGITAAVGINAGDGDPYGGWDVDTLTGNFTADSTSMDIVLGSTGDLFLITGVVLKVPSLPVYLTGKKGKVCHFSTSGSTTIDLSVNAISTHIYHHDDYDGPCVQNLCYAMTDNVAELYSFDMDNTTLPTKVVLSQLINGEGSTYRASDNAIYTFHQPLGTDNTTDPSDLYKVELDGTVTLVKAGFLSMQGVGAEFVKYSDGSERLITLVNEYDSKIEIYDAADLTNATPIKTIPLFFPDGSTATVAGLAVNPNSGEILVIDDAADEDADHLVDFPEIYSVNMNTGMLTLKTTLKVAGIDAESLAFAEDGNLYLENEDWQTTAGYENRIFRVDLSTGDITAVEENINNVVSGDIESMSCTGSKIITPAPPPPKVYNSQPCGVPGFLETFGAGVGRGPIPTSAWSNYDYDEGDADTNNGAIVMDDQYTVLDKSSIPSAGDWWIVDDDHTGDPNGRMLMVNADYFAGEFYRQSITGLEIGKKYSFAAYIANAEGDTEVRIPVNVKFALESGGAEIASVNTGDILQDPGRDELAWAKYELVFTATSTDVDIVLVNNIGGGIGNDLVIDDISISEVCDVCTAFSGEVAEADLPLSSSLTAGDKLFLPSKDVGSQTGHLRAFEVDASGVPADLASWDAATLMDATERKAGLYSSEASGNIVLFDSLEDEAFSSDPATTKTTVFAAALGGVSRGNSLEILGNSMNTSLYLYDTKYRSYYSGTVASRSKRILMSSDDGFLYAFDYGSGELAWAWTPLSLVKEMTDSTSLQDKHLMAGTLQILDLKNSSGDYATYVIGSYKAGVGHFVLKLDAHGDLDTVVFDTDQSSGFVKSPNNGEMEFFRDGSGLVHAAYVLTSSAGTSRLVVKSLTDTSTDLAVNLNYEVSSTPFVMQDYGKSNAPAKKTVYLGTNNGEIHAAKLLTAAGDIESDANIKAGLENTAVATMDDTPTDAVTYINASVAAKDNRYYLSGQTATRLTVFNYDSSTSAWKKKWTSYVSGAGTWNDSGTYSADNSGVPGDQGGFFITPPATGIQSLPADATITDKAVIVGDTVVLPLTNFPTSLTTCYGQAMYYLYSLVDGKFPYKSLFKTDRTAIESNIALGYGEASQLSISDLLGKDQLLGFGLADQRLDKTVGLGKPFVIKDPVATGIRGWKEIGR
jgi:hypothetical protein